MKSTSYRIVLYTIITFAFGMTSCSTMKSSGLKRQRDLDPITRKEWMVKKKGYYDIPVLFGTNRKRSGNTSIDKFFSGEPSSRNEYGLITVSIPFNHMSGKMERPDWWDKLVGKSYSPANFIDITSNKILTKDQFQNIIQKSESGEVFVYIHGYNCSFADAARRTAQLYYDLNFHYGLPILYSWPSKDGILDYEYDADMATYSVNRFSDFLKELVKNNPSVHVNIIAHSMGNRILTKAISRIRVIDPSIKFHHIIMAAPDVYEKDFQDNEAINMFNSCNDVTLYASSNDRALSISCRFHSGITRLGQAGSKLVILKPMITIDASSVDCPDILGHSCHGESRQIIKDISYILRNEEPDGELRKLNKTFLRGYIDNYWKFPLFQHR